MILADLEKQISKWQIKSSQVAFNNKKPSCR